MWCSKKQTGLQGKSNKSWVLKYIFFVSLLCSSLASLLSKNLKNVFTGSFVEFTWKRQSLLLLLHDSSIFPKVFHFHKIVFPNTPLLLLFRSHWISAWLSRNSKIICFSLLRFLKSNKTNSNNNNTSVSHGRITFHFTDELLLVLIRFFGSISGRFKWEMMMLDGGWRPFTFSWLFSRN